MGSGSVLRIFRQEDGDLILSIYDPDKGADCSIELCAPFTGGGQHSLLWHVLARFFNHYIKTAEEYDPSSRNPFRAD